MTHKWDMNKFGQLAFEEYTRGMAGEDRVWILQPKSVRDDFTRVGLAIVRSAEAELMSEANGLHFTGGPAEWLTGRMQALVELEKRGPRMETWYQLAIIGVSALCQMAYNIAKEKDND